MRYFFAKQYGLFAFQHIWAMWKTAKFKLQNNNFLPAEMYLFTILNY